MDQPFVIFPAIDLKAGRVVRLQQGRADAETIYDDNPADVARRWEEQGARFLHVVDLDGAFAGAPRNWDGVKAILDAVQIPIQLGGGLREIALIEAALNMGVTRVVVGTKACESPEFIEQLVEKCGPRLIVGIDARDGFVAVKGWTEKTALPALEFAADIERLGVRSIIFTDVSTDGMLTGPNYYAIAAMCDAVGCNIIASGGVGSLGDIHRLQRVAKEVKHHNLVGVIVGKALYDGRVDLRHLDTF